MQSSKGSFIYYVSIYRGKGVRKWPFFAYFPYIEYAYLGRKGCLKNLKNDWVGGLGKLPFLLTVHYCIYGDIPIVGGWVRNFQKYGDVIYEWSLKEFNEA